MGARQINRSRFMTDQPEVDSRLQPRPSAGLRSGLRLLVSRHEAVQVHHIVGGRRTVADDELAVADDVGRRLKGEPELTDEPVRPRPRRAAEVEVDALVRRIEWEVCGPDRHPAGAFPVLRCQVADDAYVVRGGEDSGARVWKRPYHDLRMGRQVPAGDVKRIEKCADGGAASGCAYFGRTER